MENSKLLAIITRLQAMMDGENQEVVSRRFEVEGVIKAVVYYDPAAASFALEDAQTHQRFEFDNIDLTAMEIFDLLDA